MCVHLKCFVNQAHLKHPQTECYICLIPHALHVFFKVYTVNGPSFKIIFNICKKVTCGSDTSSSACLVTGGKNSSIGRLDESAVEYLDNMIVLSYQ